VGSEVDLKNRTSTWIDQEVAAVREVLALPEHHPYKYQTIEHLARLQMNLQARQNESRLFREVVMNLSPVYDEWREKTVSEGREQGISLGREQGISLGRKQGIPFGQLELLKRQLTAKFDRLSPQRLEPLDRLNSKQLSELAIALLSFGELADLDRWLQVHGI
jgi:flagellar biosynthesis/type III secretory pathway protein FliH